MANTGAVLDFGKLAKGKNEDPSTTLKNVKRELEGYRHSVHLVRGDQDKLGKSLDIISGRFANLSHELRKAKQEGKEIDKIFDEYIKPNMKIKDAWDYVCKTWLNDLYGQDVSNLLPYIIRGKVNENSLAIGLNSEFYIEEVKKMFRIQNNVKIKIDKSLSISTKISKPTFKVLNATLQQGVPYFDHLPWSIRIKFRENGTKEQRDEALYQIIKSNEKTRKNTKS